MNPIYFILPVVVIALLSLPFLLRKKDSVKAAKRSLKLNLAVFAVIALSLFALPGMAYASTKTEVTPTAETTSATTEATDATTTAASDNSKGLGYIAAALATGIACLGAGIAVGGAAPAAIGAVSEDASAFGKSIIFVVLGEGVAIYGVLISIMIIGKL